MASRRDAYTGRYLSRQEIGRRSYQALADLRKAQGYASNSPDPTWTTTPLADDDTYAASVPCPVRIPTRDGRTLACDRPLGHTLAHYPKIGSGR